MLCYAMLRREGEEGRGRRQRRRQEGRRQAGRCGEGTAQARRREGLGGGEGGGGREEGPAVAQRPDVLAQLPPAPQGAPSPAPPPSVRVRAENGVAPRAGAPADGRAQDRLLAGRAPPLPDGDEQRGGGRLVPGEAPPRGGAAEGHAQVGRGRGAARTPSSYGRRSRSTFLLWQARAPSSCGRRGAAAAAPRASTRTRWSGWRTSWCPHPARTRGVALCP